MRCDLITFFSRNGKFLCYLSSRPRLAQAQAQALALTLTPTSTVTPTVTASASAVRLWVRLGAAVARRSPFGRCVCTRLYDGFDMCL